MTELQDPQAAFDIEQLFQFVVSLRGGDFAARLPVEGDGRAREIAIHLNRHMEQMDCLLTEITRIAKEIAAGRFGGLIASEMPPGKWGDAVNAMNVMEWAITDQIRDCVSTTARLAAGKADRPVTVKCEGETAALKENLNAIVARMKG